MAQLRSLPIETDRLSHVASLVEAFKAFDADNDGSITVAELGGILASLGQEVREQDVKAMMQRGDTNRDGLLSLEEFLEMNMKDLGLGGIASLLGPAFEALNLSGDQVISGEELFEATVNLGIGLSLEDCLGIITSMDRDGDGVVTFEEFKLIVNSL